MLTNIIWFAGGIICTLAALFVAVCLQSKAWDCDEMAAWHRKMDRMERDNNAG